MGLIRAHRKMKNHKSRSDEEKTEADELNELEALVVEVPEELEEEEEDEDKYLKDGEYNVEKILKMKIEKGKKMFFVKWDGYPSSQNTWEPIDHLSNIPTMVEEFEKEHREKSQTQAKKTGSTTRPKEPKSLKRFATANLTDETITKKIKGNPKSKTQEEGYQAEESSPTGDQSPIVEIAEEEEIVDSKNPNQRKVVKSQAPPKRVQAQKMKEKLGSFKQKDKPLCIKGVKPGKSGEFFFIVEWEKRSDGVKPDNSHVSNKEFKVSAPDFLFEFYESKLVVFSRKKPQVVGEQQIPSPIENALDHPLDSKKFNDKNNIEVIEQMTRELDAHGDDDDF